jgi:phosphate-selective porin
MRWHALRAGALALVLASSAWAQTGSVPRRLALSGAPAWNESESAGEQKAKKQKKEDKETIRLVWDDRPSFRFGNLLRVDVRFKFQGDFRGSQQDLSDSGGLWDVHRRRVGLEGTFLKHFEYQIEKELKKKGPWRDVFVNFRYFSAVQIQVGKFKVPFSLEQTTGSTQLDFIYRSLLANQIAPARDVGAMVHGRLFRALRYEAGVFRRDGENASITEPMFLATGEKVPSQRSVAARVVVTPLRALAAPEAL